MTPTDIAPIVSYARRQLRAERVGCILQAEQVAHLCEAYAEAIARLARIEAIASTAPPAQDAALALEEIERVCKIGQIGT